jgi:sortase A
MKILIRGNSPRRVLRWTERTLFAAAFVLLGYGGYVLVDTWIFQRQESAALERFVPEQSPEKNAESVAASAIGPDGLIGRLELPRLSVSVIVAEGTTSKVLRHAVGHIAGTALPGQAGNIGIAGHRDSFFRPLRNIQQEDVIELTTARGIYRYRVVSTKVVKPEDTAVLDSDGREILTLVTCYPFYFVGSAPERFIVRAERVAI